MARRRDLVSIRGKKHWRWRAVDQDGLVLENLAQTRRNAKAAKYLMRKLLKGRGRSPRVMIIDELHPMAKKREMAPGVEHCAAAMCLWVNVARV